MKDTLFHMNASNFEIKIFNILAMFRDFRGYLICNTEKRAIFHFQKFTLYVSKCIALFKMLRSSTHNEARLKSENMYVSEEQIQKSFFSRRRSASKVLQEIFIANFLSVETKSFYACRFVFETNESFRPGLANAFESMYFNKMSLF